MPKIREYDETTSLDDADNFLVDKAQQPNGSRYHRMTWATFKAFFTTQLTQYVTSVAGRGGDVVLSVSDVSGAATDADLDAHVADTANPHEVTQTQVGLGNVDNTSDADKPVSTATQTALDLKADDADLDAHVADTTNPHSVTKSQVGLGSVDNVSAASLRDRSTHTGTQSLSTISDAGTAAASDTGDFATAAQGTLADGALQPDDIGSTVQAYDAVLADISGYTPTKGNILVGNGTTFAQVGVGDDDQALIADSAETAGVRWGDVAASVTFAGFQAHKNGTNQAGIAPDTFTKVTFGTESFDEGGYYDAANSRITPPAGKWLLLASIAVSAGVTSGNAYACFLYKNGSNYLRFAGAQASGTGYITLANTVLVEANGTDYFEVYVYLTGSGNKTISGLSSDTAFSGLRVA